MSCGRKFIAACVQLCSGADQADNIRRASEMIRRAAGYGALLVCTPENTPFLGPSYHKIDMGEFTEGPSVGAGSIVKVFSELAAELRIHLVLGSMTEAVELADGSKSRDKCYNTSVLFGPGGEMLAKYRKIHLFDVAVKNGPTFKESSFILPGEELVTCATEVGNLGLSICYDLRFAEMYTNLVRKGANVICVPSAFTAMTGKDHWRPLLQARAIETQCWVLAPGQWGVHDEKGTRQSYGHSMIIDPWGCVVAEKGDGEGLALAEIDLDRIDDVREGIPVQSHRRLSLA